MHVNRRVLVVEDEARLARALLAGLKSDYNTALASDAPTAVALLDSFRPDVILLDMILPQGSGLDVLRAAAGSHRSAARVLVMSGWATDLDVDPFDQVVAGILPKPFSLRQARQMIEQAFANQPSEVEAPIPDRTGRAVLILSEGCGRRSSWTDYLEAAGYRTQVCDRPEEALVALKHQQYDALVCDWVLPGACGLDLLREARQRQSELPVILLTDYEAPLFTRRALSLGASALLVKPVTPPELWTTLVNCWLPRPTGQARGSGGDGARYRTSDLLGQSSAMQEVREQIRRIARMGSAVLIQGETGTGKELAAHALHAESPRSDGPLVVLRSSQIPEPMLEQSGRLMAAHGGTLVLDEIGDLPLLMQEKLLSLLDQLETSFPREGPGRPDLRVVTTTARDLAAMVAEGSFRKDLYYRLHVFGLNLPPLRHRPEDLPVLISRFLGALGAQFGQSELGISGEAAELLRCYHWPGNVRELQNVLVYAHAMAEGGTILPAHLPGWLRSLSTQEDPDFDQSDSERQAILHALSAAGGNKARAARLLGMSRSSLYVKLQLYRITEGGSV
jgi:DNA-binding NtrC family response regulator